MADTLDRCTVALLPWLRIPEKILLGDVTFVPFNAEADSSAGVRQFASQIGAMLQSYRDLKGNSVKKTTLAYLDPDRPFVLSDEDVHSINKAAQLLTLAALSCNEYFQFFPRNTNSSSFAVVCQNFKPGDHGIAFRKRCRSGYIIDGGYDYADISISVPLACSELREVAFDLGLLNALGSVATGSDDLSRRVIDATFFFNYANRLSQELSAEQEVIFSAIAFEALLELKDGAYQLTQIIEGKLAGFGSVEASQSKRACNSNFVRDDPKRAKWYLHRVWAYEFYQLRNCFAHGNSLSSQEWTWSVDEHLVLASFLYPLLVKILLNHDGRYDLSDDDEAHLGAIDKLLDTESWGERTDGTESQTSAWQEVLYAEKLERE